MSVLRKLYEKLNENSTLEFTKHEPTHPEYPDYVRGRVYRIQIKSAPTLSGYNYMSHFIAASFVLPRNVKHDELGFNINIVKDLGVKGGSQISFLSRKDAERFIKEYNIDEEANVYISREAGKFIRIDNYSDIPCYANPESSIFYSGRELKKFSDNLTNRILKKDKIHKENTFMDEADKKETERIETKKRERLSALYSKIEEKWEVFTKISTDIVSFEEKLRNETQSNLSNSVVAKGYIKKNLVSDIFKDWYNNEAIYDKKHNIENKEDTFKSYIKTDSNRARIYLEFTSLLFKTENLDKDVFNAFKQKLFSEELEKRLFTEFKNVENVTVNAFYQHNETKIVLWCWPQEITEAGIKNIVDNVSKATIMVKNVIQDVFADEHLWKPKTFTIDDFDEEE